MHSTFLSLSSTKSSPGSLMQATNSDVVKRGCLYVKRPPATNPVRLRFKAWQKRYLVLRDMLTQDGDALLELHSSKMAAHTSAEGEWKGTASDRRSCSINLRNVVHVDVYKDSKTFPHAFIAFRAGTVPVIFGAKTDLEMREWMVVIRLMADKILRLTPFTTRDGKTPTTSTRQTVDSRQTRLPLRSTLRKSEPIHRSTPTMLLDNGNGSRKMSAEMSRHSQTSPDRESIPDQTSSESNSKFLVTIQKTEDAALLRLSGRYHMIVTASEICLKRPGADDDEEEEEEEEEEACIFWPLQHIVKLKSEHQADGDLITLVASSRCGRSQGTYTFCSAEGMNLIRKVRLSARTLDSSDSSCRRQQRDIAMLKHIASSNSGNSITPIVENSSSNQLTNSRRPSMTLSRDSLARGRLTDSGFESSDETFSFNDNPPTPPPRPIHTIA